MSEEIQASIEPSGLEQSTSESATLEQDLSQQDLESLVGEGSSESASAQDAKEELDVAREKLASADSKKEQKDAKAQVELALRKYKLKVDGVEEEVELNDQEIAKELQLARKARKEIQDSSELKKEISKFLQDLKNDPLKILKDPALGLDVDRLTEEYLAKKLEDQMKDPVQLEKERLEAELEELRNEQKRTLEEREKQEYELLVQKHEQDLEEKTQEALETSGLPKSPYVLKRMADVMMSALQNQKDITPKQALNIVKKEMNRDLKEMFSVSSEDLLEELLGGDNLKRLNKRQLSKLKEIRSASSVKDTGHIPEQIERTRPAEGKKMTINEWLRKK